MPEGDTIRRTARTLHAALAERTLTGFASSLPAVEAAAGRLKIVGREIASVEARGKHLLVRFAGGPVLHTHLGMHGSWHLRRVGSARGEGRAARARLVTAEAVALCFRAPVVELLSPAQAVAHTALVRLGPDLLDDGFDAAAARARLRQRADDEIGVALVDQTVLAGVGNVYKAEVLFLCGVAPRKRVRDLDEGTLDRIVATAARLLRANLGPGLRRTTPSPAPDRLWVYGRTDRPCRRCGTPLTRIVQGGASTATLARSTVFCPRCQS